MKEKIHSERKMALKSLISSFGFLVFITIATTRTLSLPLERALERRVTSLEDVSLSKIFPPVVSGQPLGVSYPVPTYLGPLASIPYVSNLAVGSDGKQVLFGSVQTPFPSLTSFSSRFPKLNNYANTPYLFLG